MLNRCRLKSRTQLPVNTWGHRFKSTKQWKPSIIDVATLPAKSVLLEKTLKPWQDDAVRACLAAIDVGRTRIGMHTFGDPSLSLLPNLLDRIQPSPNARANVPQAVVVADKMRAVKIAHTLAQHRVDWKVEIDTIGSIPPSEADVLVTTYEHALNDRKAKNRFMQRFDMTGLKAIVLSNPESCPDFNLLWSRLFETPETEEDEANSRADATRLQTPEPEEDEANPQAATLLHNPVVIGTTMKDDLNTLLRLDHIPEVVYRRTFLHSLAENWECNPRFVAIPAPLGLRNLHIKSKIDFQQLPLAKTMREPQALALTVKGWRDHAATRKSTVVYCVNDRHAQKLQQKFKDANIDARTPTDDRYTAKFEAGEFPVLIVTHRNTIELPQVDCVVLATPTLDTTAFGNQLLSAMKASPETGKEDSLVIQIVDANRAKRSQEYDLADLLQLPVGEIQGQALDTVPLRAEQMSIAALKQEIVDRERRRIERENRPPKYKPTAAERAERAERLGLKKAMPYEVSEKAPQDEQDEALDTVNQFFASKSGRHWVRCAPGVYLHDCRSRGHAIIRRKETAEGANDYEAYWSPVTLVDGLAQGGPPAQWLTAQSPKLEDVLPHVGEFLDFYTPSIDEEAMVKASEFQLAALKGLYTHSTMPYVLTNGQAISRNKFFKYLTRREASGALGRLRYPHDADPVPFTLAEQAVILKRINDNKKPALPRFPTRGELQKRKRASLDRLRERRRQEKAQEREKEKEKQKAREKQKEKQNQRKR
ncbi:hypothetical protein B0H16DRAFT_1717620 [Mycena metata]|uniref:Helicase C-terminal domain-containing protein n=1 Tax=Mycena metata TaxID=1033252 RepID=A0AAD7JLB7_9AGAR|nr:hypothetical protein B0H16DRAFT_1717620 [Mycena metata]